MDVTLAALIGLIALALLFDFTNGFHDSANAIATVVATHVLRPRVAVAWAAFFNFAALLIVGTAVANTVGQTVKTEYFGLPVVFAALLGAVIWNYLSWWLALPTSSSHALVGALVGAGLARGGPDAIHGGSVQKTALFILISPVAGLLIGGAVMLVLRLLLRRADVVRTERRFRYAQLVSSAAVSLAHGGNNAQKTMGVVAALLVATGHLEASGDQLTIPLWVEVSAYTAIALGTVSGGWRIIRTMGTRITQLRPVSGFAAETGAAVALFGSTYLGAPVSSTHTVAGAIAGAGSQNRAATVNWSIFGRVALAWLVTMPVAAALAALVYWGATLPPEPYNVVLMGLVLLVLGTLLVVALRRAPSADEIEDEITGDHEAPLRAGTGSLTGTARVPLTSPEPDPDRARAVAKEIEQPL
ncbi:inorganic phosphate transporter [Actinoplanes sp. M2I2]|uniref:inorganic phosphate transporter n=1 Tax=Actinoplanes sp. M2I2 TaxID=1734444 RepID=UPI002020C7D4|nr:inorganic phosphate transporter [Actinoplanes sp. M2I2]